MIHLIQIAPKNFFIPLHKEVAFQSSASNEKELSQELVFLVIEFQNGMKQPQNREVWTKKILAVILCYTAFDQ